MDAWNITSTIPSTTNIISGITPSLPTILNYSDPLLSKILTSKKALQLLESNFVSPPSFSSNDEGEHTTSDQSSKEKSLIELLIAACDGDLVTLESITRSNPQLVNQLFPTQEAGVSALIYAICFNNYDIADSLLNNHNADPDLCDTLVNYTPLMWAVYFNQLDIVKLLLDHQADPFKCPNENEDKNAVSLVTLENIEMYEFFKTHNLLHQQRGSGSFDDGSDQLYGSSSFLPQDNYEDDLSTKLKMQTLTGTERGPDEDDEEEQAKGRDEDDEYVLSQDPILRQLPEFDYEKLLPEQYLKFTDSDIPSLLDYIFGLRSKPKYQHITKLPAAIVFQLIRYSYLKVESIELTEFLFDCFTARLRTVTNTKSGAFNMALQDSDSSNPHGGAGDIVSLSYWLSCLQFLHFYFTKNEIYSKFPQFLQEIINLVQSLIATLSFSINSRLNLLVDECLLDFINLVDVSNVLYAKDWNLFKSKSTLHPSTYDDILDMLYPPNERELMKPSPIRYIQVLGALDYVLKIHQVDNLLKIQTFSQVFYYINCIIFNRIISQNKYCSRAKAIQIRLNISTIEDWLRSHNMKVYKPDAIGGIEKLVPPETKLNNLLQLEEQKDEPDKKPSTTTQKKNPHYLQFYYNSLYHVGKNQLTPTIELLQWLQCLSSLHDEDSFINTINQFDSLNYYQLLKIVNKLYKYEINESKFPKKLIQLLKKLVSQQGEQQIQTGFLHYMTQSTFLSKEVYIYLNPNFIFSVALPNITELIDNYGSGIGGVKILRGKKYQPSLPIGIMDDIDEILTENKNSQLAEYDYERQEQDMDYNDDEEEDGEEGGEERVDERKKKDDDEEKERFKGDQLFKEVQMPNVLMHKEWEKPSMDDFETNPW
ncbi:uncharacterized protein J8A68_005707 [[Candida] subhashii]|uniref:Dilute domain-containing protein n=1 Tax=[Candida] subhashii TaxID=561895 RepID=A0A8J5QLI8_9ASCO|nr:uncharacterized protein J8A68_005707 [[Candida] subhashii]KAG7660745.1 hypothetical protein J8A68_005707 [[Candida] subhashii]